MVLSSQLTESPHLFFSSSKRVGPTYPFHTPSFNSVRWLFDIRFTIVFIVHKKNTLIIPKISQGKRDQISSILGDIGQVILATYVIRTNFDTTNLFSIELGLAGCSFFWITSILMKGKYGVPCKWISYIWVRFYVLHTRFDW